MNKIIDIKTMQNDLTVFNQIAASSATNMKANFDAQLSGLSQSFSNTASTLSAAFGISANDILTSITNAFIGIDTAAITSNTNVSAAFTSLINVIKSKFLFNLNLR